MSAIAGTYRNGRIELDCPPPAGWADGTELNIALAKPVGESDITGDSPEAIAAWLKWYEEFSKLPRDEVAARELEDILRRNKEAGKAMVAAQFRIADEAAR